MTDSAVFFSNDMGKLADCLAQQLFPPGATPFAQRIVVVPSQTMKAFIQQHWAKKSQLGIAAGVEFIEMLDALSMISSFGESKILPSALELTLHLYSTVKRLMVEKEQAIKGLLRYLEGKEDRLFPLCEQLACLFLDYGKYGEGQIEEWTQKEGWQATLWRACFENTNLSYPLRIFSSSTCKLYFHLFGFSYLPASYARYFKLYAASFYLFSPCSEYWGDYVSDKAYMRQALCWKKKGVKEKELAVLDHYITEQHPLLSNWGQAGRFLLEVLRTEEMIGDEHYIEKEARTRLQNLQRSILHLDGLSSTFEQDDSLQIFAVPSRLREVESLLDAIKSLLLRHQKDQQPLLPGDILVLIPDVNLYLPYLHAVFGSEESNLSYTIAGIERKRMSVLAEALRHILSLFEAGFDVQSLLTLFYMRPFRDKQKWDEDDLSQIVSWIEKSGITWGYDGTQRAQIVKVSDSLEERGSWSFGFDRLLFGLTCQNKCSQEASLPAPISFLEWTDVDLFGQLLDVIEKLQRDAAYCATPETRTLAEWTNWINTLSARYFLASEEENWLYSSLLRLTRIGCILDQPRLHFVDFCRIVDDLLSRRSGHFGSADLQTIRFVSLNEGTVLPARMICLLGMEEGAFPRIENSTSLCELTLIRPSRIACDRYLFLEVCLKANDYLRISYVSRSSQDKTELMPSIVLQELLEWLKKNDPQFTAISIPSLAISQEALEQFPFFSSTRYQAAQHYYGITPKRSFEKKLPSVLPPDTWPEEEEIRLEDLYRCLVNPLSFYFSKVLKFSLKREKKQDFAAEEFSLASWDIQKLAKENLFVPLHEVIEQAKQHGMFPIGGFEEIARVQIQQENEKLRRQLELFQVVPEDCFTAILSRCCYEPKHLEPGKLLLPAWEIVYENRTYYVTGELEGLSPQGLVCFATDKPEAFLPFWPHYLVLAGHPSLQSIPSVLLPVVKENMQDSRRAWPAAEPKEEMGKLLLYYQKAQTLISPLLAKWVPEFFGPYEKFEKMMSEETNIYAEWLVQQQGLSYAKSLSDLWRSYLENVFAAFLMPFQKNLKID